jgi:CubicO group peptidase (beta-lactamase class C family)
MIDGDSSYILSFGQRDPGQNKPILKDDVFEFGGVTKIFTAMITLALAAENKINLHTSINTYLPVKNPAFDSCTLFKLLTHTAGLPKYPPGWGDLEKDSQNPYASFNHDDIEHYFTQVTESKTGHSDYLYSHLNYVLIAWVLEVVSGYPYADLLKKYLPGNILASPDLLPTVQGYGLNMAPAKPWKCLAFAPTVGNRGSLMDLMNICQLFLNGDPVFKPMVMAYPAHIRKKISWVAMGWQALPIPKNRFVFAHTGRTKGHHTFIGILPNTGTGVVVLSNSAPGSDVLGLSILSMMNRNWKRKN